MAVYFIIGIIVLLILMLLASGYRKAPPNEAYIISGLGKRRVLIGKAGIKIPFFERLDKISLRVMQVDVKTSDAIPTNEFINVNVDAVANVKVSSNGELLQQAAESLLAMDEDEMNNMITQVLEGNIREIVGSMGLKQLVQERQTVAEKIKENAVPDMEKLGIEIVNFNIQNFKDNAGTIENLGIDNVEQIRKSAQIARSNAERDISIAASNAKEEANAVRVETEKKIAGQDAELEIQKSEMKKKADIKKAEADSAYRIQEQEQRKTVEISTTNADIAKREKETELADREIDLQVKRLDAEVMKTAEAEKYKVQQEAEAELIKRQKEAEAKRYEVEQESTAQKAKADALKYSMEKEAEGIKAKGLAEAEAIAKKAEAQMKMGEAAVLEMYFNTLPEVVKNAAEPLAKVDSIHMYGDGNANKLVGDVMQSTNQIIEGLKGATGIDLGAVLAGFAGGALSVKKEQDVNVNINASKDDSKDTDQDNQEEKD